MKLCTATSLMLAIAAGPVLGTPTAQNLAWFNRVTWGVSATPILGVQPGSDRWLDLQLKRPDGSLPSEAAAQVASMKISQTPMAELVIEEEEAIRSANSLTDPGQRDIARKTYQQSMTNLANEAAAR